MSGQGLPGGARAPGGYRQGVLHILYPRPIRQVRAMDGSWRAWSRACAVQRMLECQHAEVAGWNRGETVISEARLEPLPSFSNRYTLFSTRSYTPCASGRQFCQHTEPVPHGTRHTIPCPHPAAETIPCTSSPLSLPLTVLQHSQPPKRHPPTPE